MATITLTKKNVFSRISKLIGLLDQYDSIKVKYDLPVDDDPDWVNVTPSQAHKIQKKLQDFHDGKLETVNLETYMQNRGVTV